jgi:DNA ligase (NAD+)
MEEGLISDAADLYELRQEDLAGLPGLGEKSAENLITAIKQSREVALSRFIYALGIRHVGTQTAIDLAAHFGSLNALRQAEVGEIAGIAGVGPVVAESVADYFADRKNAMLVDRLTKSMKIKSDRSATQAAGKLAGQTFVITGTLDSMSRDEAKELIRSLGGKVSGSISASTDYLVAGDKPGSKLAKAEKLGVEVLNEESFLSKVKQ